MPDHQARPSRVMALWGNGGFLLGFVTALMGRLQHPLVSEVVAFTGSSRFPYLP